MTTSFAKDEINNLTKHAIVSLAILAELTPEQFNVIPHFEMFFLMQNFPASCYSIGSIDDLLSNQDALNLLSKIHSISGIDLYTFIVAYQDRLICNTKILVS